MDQWRGKVAVVTGASAGIGARITRRLVEEGLEVVGLARRIESIKRLSKELKENSENLHAMVCDVSNENEIYTVFESIRRTIGPIQILINNAAIIKNESLTEGKPESWREMIDTNLLGLLLCSTVAIKQMREADIPGHIININSELGHEIPHRKDAIYNLYPSLKFGITALTPVLTQEMTYFQTKVKISSISPGLVGSTELFSSAKVDNMSVQTVNKIPHLLPDDVSNAIIYVLSTPPHVQVSEVMLKPILSKP